MLSAYGAMMLVLVNVSKTIKEIPTRDVDQSVCLVLTAQPTERALEINVVIPVQESVVKVLNVKSSITYHDVRALMDTLVILSHGAIYDPRNQ